MLNPVIMVTMRETRTQTLMFDPLAPDGTNFLEWNSDVTTYLCAEELDGALDRATAAEMATT